MAFKTVESYNEARFGGFFLLRNDGDFADVVFMYRNKDDVLVADTHYVKGSDYSGYVHCCGRGCPACSKGSVFRQSSSFLFTTSMRRRFSSGTEQCVLSLSS